MWFQQWEEKSESQARCGSGVSLLKANYSPKSPPKKSCLAGLVLQTAVKGDQPSQTVFDEVADTVPLKHILSTFPSSKNSGHCSLLRVAVYWSSARGKLKCPERHALNMLSGYSVYAAQDCTALSKIIPYLLAHIQFSAIICRIV